MKHNTGANLFALRIVPGLPALFRCRRDQFAGTDDCVTIPWGRFVYAERKLPLFEPIERPEPEVLHRFIRLKLTRAIGADQRFFDVGAFTISATVSGELLHKEEAFSIATTFEAQVLHRQESLYIAILAGTRLYNRLRLTAVLGILDATALRMPARALCFAGTAGEERWRDGLLLRVSSDETCVIRVPSLSPSELTVPWERVIPKLKRAHINHVARQRGSHTRIDQLIKKLHTDGVKDEGETTYYRSLAICRTYIAPLFPITIGGARVELVTETTDLLTVGATTVAGTFARRSPADGHAEPFQSVVHGLRRTRFETVRDCPVGIFCTKASKDAVVRLVEDLNAPREAFAGFQGMPAHFGIRLVPVTAEPFVVGDVEQYMDLASDLTLSANPQRQEALGLFVLAEDEEPYTHPVPLYYRLKALMARTGHASQVIEPATLQEKYARWNIAVQLAAKLGGVPWMLDDPESLAPVDLFLGFSYSSIRTDQLGESRNIGYVNVFDRAGTWRVLCADAAAFSFEQRLSVFPKLASEAVRTATDEPEKLRLVEVHYNKRFGIQERKSIVEGVRRVAPGAGILFVSLNDDHPVRMFEKGHAQMAAPRGTLFRLDAHMGYLQTINGSSHTGLPRPLRFCVYSDFCDDPGAIHGCAGRILALSELNWRSVHDFASLPVTILYSSLVARLANYFRLTDWHQFVDHQLKRTPWFL